MSAPKSCAGCGGRSVLLRHDGVYFFVSCEQCEKSGPRGDSPQAALELWDAASAVYFQYGEDMRKSRILKRLECGQSERQSVRCAVDLPVVMTVGGTKSHGVTGVMRNVSFFGAFVELTGGEMGALPLSVDGFADLPAYLHFSLPKALRALRPDDPEHLLYRFGPRHMHQRRDKIGLGGCFLQPDREQAEVLSFLVTHACGEREA